MKTLALKSIEFYQRFLSPLLGGRCRFYPSCSNYAHGCFEQLGFFEALGRTTWRLLKCQPLHSGGIDPVPARFVVKISSSMVTGGGGA